MKSTRYTECSSVQCYGRRWAGWLTHCPDCGSSLTLLREPVWSVPMASEGAA